MVYSRAYNLKCNETNGSWDKFYSEQSVDCIFTLTRFKEHLGLPEFTHLEFEEELQREKHNYGADEANVYRSLLLTQIYEVLLKKATKKETVKELDVLFIIFARRQFDPNPFEGMDSCDFHLLPTEVKIWIYLQLLNYHLYSDSAQDVDAWLSPDLLRATKYPTQSGLFYYYFHDMRIFRKHFSVCFEKRQSEYDIDVLEKEPWRDIYLDNLRGNQYECVARDHVTWAAFIKDFGQTGRRDACEFRSLYKHCVKDCLQDLINLYQAQKASRARLCAQMDLEKRRSLGLFRSSSRLQLKRKLEEDNQDDSDYDGPSSSKQMSREERLLRREENKDLMFDIMENKLTVDVSSSSDAKLFDSPQNTSPISLKEVNVDNFRLTNPPISPQLNTFEQNNLNNSFGAPEVAAEPAPAPPEQERVVSPPPVLTEAEQEALIGLPPGVTLSPITKRKLMKFRTTFDDFLRMTGQKGLARDQKINWAPSTRVFNSKLAAQNTPSTSTSTSEQQNVTAPATQNPTPIAPAPIRQRAVSFKQPSQASHQRMMLLWKLAVRVMKYFFTEAFQKWSAHYRMRMPKELREMFDVHFADENVQTLAQWEVIKEAIFTVPMKIGRVEEFHIPEKKVLKKDAPFRALGRDLLRANQLCWEHIWDEMTEDDHVWLRKTADRLIIIQRLIALDKEKVPSIWNWNNV